MNCKIADSFFYLFFPPYLYFQVTFFVGVWSFEVFELCCRSSFRTIGLSVATAATRHRQQLASIIDKAGDVELARWGGSSYALSRSPFILLVFASSYLFGDFMLISASKDHAPGSCYGLYSLIGNKRCCIAIIVLCFM